MKVLHVNVFDAGGGAARAAMRLHAGLRAQAVDSMFLTLKPTTGETAVFTPLVKGQQLAALVKRQVEMRIVALQKNPANPVIHSLGLFASGIGRWINSSDADVVNLHWTCAGALSVNEIAGIKKPIVWTMHDMWPFMGAEHYDDLNNPGRWKSPYVAANRPLGSYGPDIDAWVWGRKARAWADKTFHLVAPSRWLAGCAAGSALMGLQPLTVIANPLDTDVFAPIDRREARRMLGLPDSRKLILFGALGATSDRRKGYDLLVATLQALEQNHSTTGVDVMVFGGRTGGSIPDVGLKSHFVGTFHDDLSLRVVYSAADVFVAPSRQDNLPNTVVEAGACGVPTAAFDIGGMSDIITDGENGSLAPAFNTTALAVGIARLLDTQIAPDVVRSTAVAKFGLAATIPTYLSLYRRVLGQM